MQITITANAIKASTKNIIVRNFTGQQTHAQNIQNPAMINNAEAIIKKANILTFSANFSALSSVLLLRKFS